MIIDGHTHVWPDAIARKAISGRVPGLLPIGDGTISGLLDAMERAGVERSITLAIAPSSTQVDSANRFAGSLPSDRLIGFGSIHVHRTAAENVDGLRRHGLRGVKVHALFQGYRLDDRRLYEILDAIQGEFIAVIHVGGGGAPEENELSRPAMLADIVRNFPCLQVIACHFGGYWALLEAEEHVVGLPVYLDTSWPPTLAREDPSRIRALIERHGSERVIFASDWPMADPAAEIRAVERLGLSSTALERILGENLAHLLQQYS